MGYDCTNTLAPGVLLRDVRQHLHLLGYAYGGRRMDELLGVTHYFRHFEDRDYRSWGPVWATVYSEDGRIKVDTRTQIWVGRYDLTFHNETIKQLRKRFGGTFRSDYGAGRYFPVDEPEVGPAESGCYLAYGRAEENLTLLRHYLESRGAPAKLDRFEAMAAFDPGMLALNPERFANNTIIPYLVAVLEDYLKYTFVAVLKYSPRRRGVLKKARLTADALESVAEGKDSLESAIASGLAFQRISAASRHFADLDEKIDIASVLRKPWRRRRRTLFDELEALVESRHGLIHRMEIDGSLTNERINLLIEQVAASIDRIYRHLRMIFGWSATNPLPLEKARRKVVAGPKLRARGAP